MKIGIDLRPVVLGRSGGITLVMKGVLQALFARHPEHQFLVFCTVFNRDLLRDVPAHVKVWSLPLDGFNVELAQLLRLEQAEVLFRCYPHEAVDFPSSRQVVFVPDIQHEFYPEFFSAEELRSRRLRYNRDLATAGAVGTVSGYARQTILEHGWTSCRDVFLMSPALQFTGRGASPDMHAAAEQERPPFGEYFLYPANLLPHKNHHRVLRAFELFLRRAERPMGFVFTGYPEGWDEIRRTFPRLPIRHLGFVSPRRLKALYEGARALVFFSLYEGFGMPLLEAFSTRTPVICSNTTSLPEVGGDATLSCDPTDIRAMSDLMERISYDEGVREVLIARGEEVVQNYSWERSAENLLTACQRVGAAADGAAAARSISVSDAPRVSIVTPSYNQGRFIKETIDSVLSQSYGNIEYLVVDGGSTDETLSILKSYGAGLGWISEPDRGQTDAINKGFARSSGEIRAYLNSDDVLLPDAVEKAVRHFNRHPDADLLYGQARLIDERGREIGMYDTADYSFERLVHECCICQSAAFWRTRIAEKVGPFDDRLNYAMDYDYWLRIDRAGGHIVHLREPLAAWRRYAETKTSSAREEIFAEVFKVSLAHVGCVSVNWFLGLWEHRLYERSPRRLGHLLRPTDLCTYAGYLHCLWFHRNPSNFRRIINKAEQEVTSGKLSPLRPIWAATKPVKYFVRSLRRSRKPVHGLWSDNWMEPDCTVRLDSGRLRQPQRLAGVSPIDNKLSIIADGEQLETYFCPAYQRVEVILNMAAGRAAKLELKFSEHVVGPAQRRLSFLIDSTNLFDERDCSPLTREPLRTPAPPLGR